MRWRQVVPGSASPEHSRYVVEHLARVPPRTATLVRTSGWFGLKRLKHRPRLVG